MPAVLSGQGGHHPQTWDEDARLIIPCARRCCCKRSWTCQARRRHLDSTENASVGHYFRMDVITAACANIIIIEAPRDCLLHEVGQPYQKTGRLAWGNDSPAYAARLRGKVRNTAKGHPRSTLLRMYGTFRTMPKLLWAISRLERLFNFPRQHTAPTMMGTVQLLSLPVARVPTAAKPRNAFNGFHGHDPTLAMRDHMSPGHHMPYQEL